MSKIKSLSVKKNIIFNLVTQILTYLLPLITAPYLSRILTADGIGTNSFLNSIVSYFVLFVGFGFTTYGTKEIASNKLDKLNYSKIFWKVFFSKLTIFVICYTIYLLVSITTSFGKNYPLNYYISYSVLIIATLFDSSFLFNGLENFRIIALVNAIVKVIGTIILFVFVKNSTDLLIYIIVSTIQTLIVGLFSFVLALKVVDYVRINKNDIFNCLKSAFVFFTPTIAISIYTMLDKTMMGYLTFDSEIGYYEEAHKIIVIVTSIINAISPIMLARISNLILEKNEQEINKKYIQMSRVYWLISAPSICGLYAIGNIFIPTFFGDEYIESVKVLYVLIPLIAIIPISNIIGAAYYTPNNKIRIQTLFFVIGAIINFVLNFVFIKKWGAVGAAVTSLMAEFVISTLFVVFSLKDVHYIKMLFAGVKPIISAVLMFCIILIIRDFILLKYLDNNIIIVVLCVSFGIAVYGLILLILRETLVLDIIKVIRKKLIVK